jgi:hypothetical protein
LRIKYMAQRLQQFLVQRKVLALQVQHRHWPCCLGRRSGRIYGGFHLFILPVAPSSAPKTWSGDRVGKDRRLKWLRKKYNVI